MQSCGHVTCQSCVDKIVKPGKQCVACDGRAKDKDLVELKRDGTGFAAAGGAESVKVSKQTTVIRRLPLPCLP